MKFLVGGNQIYAFFLQFFLRGREGRGAVKLFCRVVGNLQKNLM